METAFRWYGPADRVRLTWLKQMTPQPRVVTHLDQFAPGETWELDAIQALRANVEAHGLRIGPFESVFWSDDMKTGGPKRDQHIAATIETLRNLRLAFPDEPQLIVTYNLMALDWSRTNLAWEHPNGARGLAFDHAKWEAMDVSRGLYLPGWGKGYSQSEFNRLTEIYGDKPAMWQHIRYVLAALVPVCEELNIRLAAHPNDPPWSTFGLPAMLCNTADIQTLFSLYPSEANALCFCTGSYGALPENNILEMIAEFATNIAWCHLRVTKTTGDRVFHEADHADPAADWDPLDIMKALIKAGFNGTFRSDHGLDILHETDMGMRGYPAIDRYAANKMLWAYHRALTNPL
jgi:mannonate dehydratase